MISEELESYCYVRIYREEGLKLRRKRPRRHVTGSRRMDRPDVECPNACFYKYKRILEKNGKVIKEKEWVEDIPRLW